MSRITLTVNRQTVSAEVTPRTHLADFLREERWLTGTHLGCEHGVCGACTLLIDGAPARSCIAFAVACDDADVRTIEGLEDDPVIEQLRAAFTAEHALQCGFCTPGMLVTARDIVQRLPDADEARIRVELAGNLCRCTGYAGIVRAIRRVLADGATAAPPTPRVWYGVPSAIHILSPNACRARG
jgi:carbon-monoxide dehydrogenase small subunit